MSEKRKPRCHNCKHAWHQFKIKKLTHLHCNHPKYHELGERGDLSPWETLRVFNDNCENHEFKPKL